MTGTPARRAAVVRWVGAQRDVLAGDLGPTIRLGELRAIEHVYALGPLEGVRGEISVFDGVPLVARVVDGSVVVTRGADEGACFLAYAGVGSWRWATVSTPLASGDVVSQVLRHAAEGSAGVASAPIAFLLRGVASTLVYHVLDKRDGLPHTPERHEHAKVRFEVCDREVEVIGFHSSAHRGIFTPGDSPVHMHFRAADERISGHVERIDLAPGWRLGLPEETTS